MFAPMHPNEELLNKFYSAFQKLDGDTMAASYHDEAHFSDPVFPSLDGPEVGAMWKMLCSRAQEFKLEYRDIEADDESGKAYWEAHYTFSRTGRRVHNKISSTFKFRDGKIVDHRDHFDLWAWTRMALGFMGVLLGWTPIVQGKVRGMARVGLDDYMKQNG